MNQLWRLWGGTTEVWRIWGQLGDTTASGPRWQSVCSRSVSRVISVISSSSFCVLCHIIYKHKHHVFTPGVKDEDLTSTVCSQYTTISLKTLQNKMLAGKIQSDHQLSVTSGGGVITAVTPADSYRCCCETRTAALIQTRCLNLTGVKTQQPERRRTFSLNDKKQSHSHTHCGSTE